MHQNIDADVYEATLIKRAVAPLNEALPQRMREAYPKALKALDDIGCNPKADTRAYAESLLWALRSGIARHAIPEWDLIGARNCLHMKHVDDGLTMRLTKSFALTGKLPPAGHNTARQKAWLQGRLRTEEEMRSLIAGRELEGDVVHITWTEVQDGEFVFDAYLPKEPSRFPKSPEAWLAFRLGVPEREYDKLSFDAAGEAPLLVPRTSIIVENPVQKKTAPKANQSNE